MKTVLVAYASQMGSTAEIASVVGDQLTRRGFHVDVQSTAVARDARLYDAVIVGSPVYFGRWDRTALRFLRAQAPDLAERPTWLFQSGPCGPGASNEPARTPRAVERFCAAVGIAAPVTFGGNLDRSKATTWLARIVATGDLAGDSRDWQSIRRWADDVADQLYSVPTPTAVKDFV